MKETKKFRAWDNKTKKMYYWDSVDHPFVERLREYVAPKLYYLPMSYLLGDNNNLIWMQCTGRKDKEGTDIYENDFISYVINQATGKTNQRTPKIVKWTCAMQLTGFNLGKGRHGTTAYLIVGNSFENPELA